MRAYAMKNRIGKGLTRLALLVLASLLLFPSGPAAAAGEVDKLVLAFYYPWYMTVPHSGYCTWNFGGFEYEDRDDECEQTMNSPHMPEGGLYDSLAPATIRRHLEESRRAGIDGWIVSWWGMDHETDALDLILSEAEKFDPDFKIALYYEMIPGCRGWFCEEQTSGARINAALADFLYLDQNYLHHPSYLTADGRPVVFVYIRAMLSGIGDWPDIIKRVNNQSEVFFSADAGFTWLAPFVPPGFDQVHFYNQVYELLALSPSLVKYKGFVRNARLYGRSAAVTVLPGYDERLVPGRPGVHLEREGGRTYRRVWENAIAADPDWILVTSFNEWYEGSEIEPSEEYGDEYLEMTAEYAERFKGSR